MRLSNIWSAVTFAEGGDC